MRTSPLHYRSGIALALILAALIPLAVLARAPEVLAQRKLEVTPYERKFKIAIQPFVGNPAAAPGPRSDVARVVSSDLDFTGIFQPLNPKSFLEDPGQTMNIDFETWRIIGAEALVKGKVTDEGGGRIAVEARIYDVFKGRRVVGKRYRGDKRHARKMAHKVANEIFKYFTGDEGVFDSQIVYAGKPTSRAKEIFVADFDGSNRRQISRNGSINNLPKWDPKGSRIAFISFKGGQPTLYMIGRGKRGARAVRPSSTIYKGVWSPGGTEMLVAGRVGTGNTEILRLSLDGRMATKLTNHPAIDSMPSWAPGGGKVAFVSDRTGTPQIYTMNPDGSSQKRISFQGGYNVNPEWSPRGDRIAYAAMVGGRFNIMTMRPDGSDVVQLTSAGNSEYPSWSPNGRQLVFQAGRGAGAAIYVINANGSNLKRIIEAPAGATAPHWSGHIP
ncbi:MAG: Tol-Pal system beta propeller repeat protein TolB [Myxococcota bacterium]